MVAVVAAGAIALTVLAVIAWRQAFPTCEEPLLEWSWPPSTGEQEAIDDRARSQVAVVAPSGRVHVDAVFTGNTGFLDWSAHSVYFVRDGTPDDLVFEAVHPYQAYEPPTSSTSSTTGTAVPAPRPTVTRPPGWKARAIASGDVVHVGTGHESVNEEVTLTAGTWHLDGDITSSVAVLGCD